ncbi:HlyD family efflux transporter periplasmic adaptor subunit [Bacteroidaceae bacterium HV4-6-C5C]|nr:HlyD family efflux transporter periplasmic adaptor subunit [Bacteroidaceae bacterium HV4-6-C5C]
MPHTFAKWVAIAVVIFTILLFFFGWIIKYPDTVIGRVKINSNIAPVKLVANTSGKMRLFAFNAQDTVKENDYIAVIQNPAKTEDIKTVNKLMAEFNLNDKSLLSRAKFIFPEKVSLGELNIKYYTFLSALKNWYSYFDKNVFEQQKISLQDDIKWKKTLLNETENVMKTTSDNLQITQKWLEKYTSLNKDYITTYEYEVDRSKIEYLSAKQSEQNLKKEFASIQMQITENQNRLAQLTIEKSERERQLQLELLSSFHELNDNLKLWEQKYVLKAPFNGRVEFLKFWANEQFIQAGEDIFGIIPQENIILGQVLLPAGGIGKVKIGNKVIIKLDNYPYTEFGSIEGNVKSISLIAQEYKNGENNFDTYLVLVDMPKGLITNYGERLDFKYEMGGQADIIVKERRLIERLFDNLKARMR